MTHPLIRRRDTGFTLIELLVVVAIIALLVAILLPSLSKARAQSRTTICLSRISQLGKAFMLYADDYAGIFPFTSTLHETYAQGPNAIETWLANWSAFTNPQEAINKVARRPQSEWEEMTNAVPKTGTLFPYARFEALYRCPEFERQAQAEQRVFNYTRALYARFWKLWQEYQAEGRSSPFQWGGVDGPILKVEQIHSPSLLPVVLDEQWNRFVGAWNLDEGTKGAYNGADYGFFTDNVVAVSHGPAVKSSMHTYDFGPDSWGERARPPMTPFLWPSGGVVCYDGHASLFRDPWPSLPLGSNARTGVYRDQANNIYRQHDERLGLSTYAVYVIFAQRGFDPKQRYGNPPQPW